mgnify:CR=1 FL=1
MAAKTVTYNPGMLIANTDQLPKGTGCKYLEAIDNGSGPFIAVAWRNKKIKLPKGRILIEFSSKRK